MNHAPTSGDEIGVEAHQLLAEVFILLKARGRAVNQLREVVRRSPGNRSARMMLALTLAAAGRRQAALQVVAQAKHDFGNDPGVETLRQQVEQQLEQSASSRVTQRGD